MDEKEMSKDELKHLNRMKKLEERKKEKIDGVPQKKGFQLNALTIAAVLLVVLGGSFALFFLNPSSAGSVNASQVNSNLTGLSVHWHATPLIEVCGVSKLIPIAPIVSHLLHTHEDRLIHVEGVISDPAMITLGEFFKKINVPFSSTQIMDKKNGDSCNGVEGKVKMLINGLESNEFENHVIADGETYSIKFE